ncbi:ABC transporter ATP-binding protein [Tabrizicola oligotrophica]|uniref:ABC transporter ATP-binding protein n=1 Tax=Tabrizicola oligotrophica TaxID=2710650 RepID=A0A6M0QU58_9RHOB|nr:ABC transporter ATP-binding protein [Tabrizicola oligotrophica]NEY90354.1 ABC transporter ATP-binding protein [Tabrizicola oligotrophica]
MSVQIKNVEKSFGALKVVKGVSVDIADGEFFVMLGPSGCGKTTTLRMVAGLELPTAGEIRIGGRDVTYEEPRHRDIAMAFQDYGLYPHLSLRGNIEFPLKVRGVPEAERRTKVESVAQKMGISHLLDRKPGQISGGQRQRVALARALVRNPRVFLMDEPLSALDAKLRATMRTEIKKLVTELKITTIYVTHDQIEAMSMADRIAVMKDGDMVQIASPLEMYERPQTKFVAEFIGSPAMNLLPARARPDGRMACDLPVLAELLPDAELTANPVAPAKMAAYIGIRPEHLSLVEGGEGQADFEAVVDLVEPLGQTTNVYLNVGDIRMIAVVDRTRVQAGQRVGVKVRREALRLVAA